MKNLNIELQKRKGEVATDNDLTPNPTSGNFTINNCIIDNTHSNATVYQRARLLEYIKHFVSATAIELRCYLDVFGGAA